ncbi:hypothetical protein ZIOFF_036251 [Zingiber officinale]|uniref:Uncharacterized protein n=1 Tax=Zingiber officinale TaxID=94328 RepID=A0A8J5GQ58_ZINOF|nr:hypothetical protein ZIOFF_036251 [Zingiber officinale]
MIHTYRMASSLSLLPLACGGRLAAAATFDIVNQCSYTVWAAASPGGGQQLDPGQTWSINVNAGTTSGRVWARTGCSFDGNGIWVATQHTGGVLAEPVPKHGLLRHLVGRRLQRADGLQPNRRQLPWGPVRGGHQRPVPGAAAGAGRLQQPVHGVSHAGILLHAGIMYFKGLCPDAYSYPQDDATSTFTCPGGTNYRVVFCP